MTARWSPYINFDAMDNASLSRCEQYLSRLKPRYLQCFTAARWNESRGLIERLMTASPESRIIWRGYAHDSLADEAFYDNQHKQGIPPVQAAYNWYQYRIRPWRDFIRAHKIIIMLLNEAAPVFNAPFETECIRLLGEDGIQAAAMAWATGTPDVPEYAHPALADCVRMMNRYGSILNRHEYGNPNPALSNDLINRYTREHLLFSDAGFRPPTTVLGEFGAVRAWLVGGRIQLDANTGWIGLGFSEEFYAAWILSMDAAWYKPRGIHWNLYQWGGAGRWASFNIDTAPALLDLLAQASQPGGQLSMADNITWQVGKVTATAGVRLRREPITGQIELTIPFQTEALVTSSAVDGWLRVRYTDQVGVVHEGFASAEYIAIVPVPPPVEPPPVTPPPITPPPEDWRVKLSSAEVGQLYAALAQANLLIAANHALLQSSVELTSQIHGLIQAITNELYAAYVLLKKAQADTGQIEAALAELDKLKTEYQSGSGTQVLRIVELAKKRVIKPSL